MPSGIYKHKKGYKRPPMSKEWREKISIANKGKLIGDKNPSKRADVRKKISVALLGNKNSLGVKRSVETINKLKEALTGSNNSRWKGSDVSYRQLHKWIRKYKGKPSLCSFCKEKASDWANVDGKYQRDLEDYISLCRKCHTLYDRK